MQTSEKSIPTCPLCSTHFDDELYRSRFVCSKNHTICEQCLSRINKDMCPLCHLSKLSQLYSPEQKPSMSTKNKKERKWKAPSSLNANKQEYIYDSLKDQIVHDQTLANIESGKQSERIIQSEIQPESQPVEEQNISNDQSNPVQKRSTISKTRKLPELYIYLFSTLKTISCIQFFFILVVLLFFDLPQTTQVVAYSVYFLMEFMLLIQGIDAKSQYIKGIIGSRTFLSKISTMFRFVQASSILYFSVGVAYIVKYGVSRSSRFNNEPVIVSLVIFIISLMRYCYISQFSKNHNETVQNEQ